MIERAIVGEATTPDGIRVVVFADTWNDHILDPEAGHPELAPHLDAVLRRSRRPTIANPTTALTGSASTSGMRVPVAG